MRVSQTAVVVAAILVSAGLVACSRHPEASPVAHVERGVTRANGDPSTILVSPGDDQVAPVEAVLDGPDGKTTIKMVNQTIVCDKHGDSVSSLMLGPDGRPLAGGAGEARVRSVTEIRHDLAQQRLKACEFCLKNLGTAANIYSTDHGGHYPPSLDKLVPNYIKAIPSCPAAGQDSYSAAYAVADKPDGFTLSCGGDNHKLATLAGYPRCTNRSPEVLAPPDTQPR